MVEQSKASLQAEITRLIADNTTGEISALDVRTVLTDITDSVSFPTPPTNPAITRFDITGQPTEVDPGTQLSGTKTFNYNISNVDEVEGNLTIKQGAATLTSAAVPGNPGSASVTINTETVNAGSSVVFTLEGTNKSMGAFSKTFTVTGRTDDDYVYYGTQVSSDPTTFAFASESRIPVSGTEQSFDIPSFVGNEYLVIAQPATQTELTAIEIDSINQFDAFTKTDDAFVVNSVNYDAWTSENALIGTQVSSETVTIVR